MGLGPRSEEEGGWQEQWQFPPPPPTPPPPNPLPRSVLSLASSDKVRGLRREGEDDKIGKFDEGSGQP